MANTRVENLIAWMGKVIASGKAATKEQIAEFQTLASDAVAPTPKGTYTVTLKVSEKGAVSVYGLGKFPVTLYPPQMEAFLSHADEIRAFIAARKDGPVVGDRAPLSFSKVRLAAPATS